MVSGDAHRAGGALDQLRLHVERQTLAEHFGFAPIGGCDASATPPMFDQQPIEAWAMASARATEYVPELVGTAVARRQDQYVRDVVEEPRSRPFVAPVAVADTPGEEVVEAVVIEQPGVEYRTVARHRPCFDNRPVVQAADLPHSCGNNHHGLTRILSRTFERERIAVLPVDENE